MPSGRVTHSWLRRIGSCQQTSGFIVSGGTPSLRALLCSAQPTPPAKPGPVQEDARVLVLAGAVLGLAVVLVEFQIALAAQALFAELPVVVGQLLHRVVQAGAVVVVGQERTVRAAPVVRAALDRALAGRRAEHTRPSRQQPGQVRRDQMLGIVGVVELHPFAGEVQFDLLSRFRMRIRHGFNVRPRFAHPSR